MRLHVSSQTLANGVGIASRLISANVTTPMLGGMLMVARDGAVTLHATNGEMSVRHVMTADVEEDGETVVSGRLLAQMAKNLPDATVNMSLEGSVLALRCGRSRYKLNTLDPEDFPTFPEIEGSQSITFDTKAFSAMVDRVRRAASKDVSRPTLTGIKVVASGGLLTMSSTDSYRMAMCETEIDGDTEFDALIPVSAMQHAAASTSETVDLRASETQAAFECGRTTYISRVIEGPFPDVRALVPKACGSRVQVVADEMSQALKRVGVVASETRTVRLAVTEDGTTVMAASPQSGDASEQVATELEGEPVTIALNYHYLQDGIDPVADDVQMELNGPTSPVVMRSYGDMRGLYLLMPVRM